MALDDEDLVLLDALRDKIRNTLTGEDEEKVLRGELAPKQDPDLDEPVIELVLEGAWTGPAPRFRGVLCSGCGNWLTADRPEGARFMSCPECMRTVAP